MNKKLKISFKSTLDIVGKDKVKSKVSFINNILGNDLDKEIILAINKKNNKLKRFARKEGLLQYQISLEHLATQYDELFYDFVLNRAYIDLSTSDVLFEICFEDGHKEYNKVKEELIFDAEEMLKLFGEFIVSLYSELTFEIVEEEIENIKTPRILNLEREVVTRCINELSDIYTEVSIPDFEDIKDFEIEHILKFSKKSLLQVYDKEELDIELIHLYKYLGDIPEVEDDFEMDDSINLVNAQQVSGIKIVFDDVEEEFMEELFEDDDRQEIYYISELDDVSNQDIHAI